MPKENITIKDIAARAGVSTGTVDRVLHKRPNVSKTALDKVNKALEELDYRPNMYASALAYNKTYNFYCVLPKHEQEAYWDEIEEGALACADFRRDFGINLKFVYYERFNAAAFTRMVREFFTAKIDGVIIVPTTLEQTARFTEKLTKRQIPLLRTGLVCQRLFRCEDADAHRRQGKGDCAGEADTRRKGGFQAAG